MLIDEGVIKFDSSDFEKVSCVQRSEYTELESARKTLYKLKLIGEYKDIKIGFGNLSLKQIYSSKPSLKKPQFIISGSQTGNLEDLDDRHYTRVVDYDLANNSVSSRGLTLPSSESLTHAAIYQSNPAINCIIHIHHKNMWTNMISNFEQSTGSEIPYGTLAMAEAMSNISNKSSSGYFVMKGHEDGIVIFSENIDKALHQTISLFHQFSNS